MICYLQVLLQVSELLKLRALANAFSAGRGARHLSCFCLCFKTSSRVKDEFVLHENKGAGET